MSSRITARALGPVSVGARAYRRRGRAFVTAIVKATFTLAQDAAMAVTKPSALHWSELARSASPVASVRRASDVALFVRQPEIILDAIGFASGPPIARMTTRLAVARGTQMLISKHIELVGDRRIPRDGPGPAPAPFQHMPIEYERAFGGLGRPDNPAGIGQAEPDGSAQVPNVRAGEGASAEPPGYGPISARWPARRALRGSQPGDGFDPEPIELAEDLDDAYFQASPADQRVDVWRPGDLIVLAGMHPTYATLRVSVPSAFGVALLVDAAGHRVPIELSADTIFVEPHLLRAEIVYRASAPIESLAGLCVFGALRGPEPFEWPAVLDETSRSMTASPLHAAPRFGAEGTLVMEPTPGADTTTLVLEGAVPPRINGRGTFDAESTIDLEPNARPQASTPFQHAPLRERSPGALGSGAGSPVHAVGTPWSGEDARHAVPVDGSRTTTMVIDPPPPAARPQAIVVHDTDEDPAPPAQRGQATPFEVVQVGGIPAELPARSERSKPKRRKAVWRDDPTETPAMAPPVAPAAVPEKRPDARERLYKKFKP